MSSFLVEASLYVQPSLQLKFKNIYLPSSFSLILMKLYAFRDRRNDINKDFGTYHAYDVFSTIINMDESDWETADKQLEEFRGTHILIESVEIVRRFFNSNNSTRIIMIKENELFQRKKKYMITIMKTS